MQYLCFGTFFSLLCGNKKDWDKKRKPSVSNRVLYFALLDIVDRQKNPKRYAEKAISGEVRGFTDDVVSIAKNCKGDHPIQRVGSMDNYKKRFVNEHESVVADYQEYIQEYFDEQQLGRLARSVIELVSNSQVCESDIFYIGDTLRDHCTKRMIAEEKNSINLPCLLAGVMYYIINNNISNYGDAAKDTIAKWNELYKDAPYCPDGSSLNREIQVVCDVSFEKKIKKIKDAGQLSESFENCFLLSNKDITFDQGKAENDNFMAERIMVKGNRQVVIGDVIEENGKKIIINGDVATLNL